MTLDDEVVEVGGLRGIKGRETKVVELFRYRNNWMTCSRDH